MNHGWESDSTAGSTNGWIVGLPILLSLHVSIHPSINQSIDLSVNLSICLSIFLSICLSNYLSIYAVMDRWQSEPTLMDRKVVGVVLVGVVAVAFSPTTAAYRVAWCGVA